MPPDPHGAAPIFAALGDETRLQLIGRLRGGPLTITNLTNGLGMTRQAVTKHLTVMHTAGLVTSKRYGRESRWELEPRRIEAAKRYLDQVSAQWDEALGRLREFVES